MRALKLQNAHEYGRLRKHQLHGVQGSHRGVVSDEYQAKDLDLDLDLTGVRGCWQRKDLSGV